MKNPRRVLVVRPDRIGDVVLTAPAIDALRHAWPRARVDLLLAPRVAPLGEALDVDATVVDPGGLFALAGRLRDGGYDLAVFPYGDARVAAAAALAGIPRRVGNGLRPYSLMLTDRVRLHRSRPPLHEVDYCLRLLAPLGIDPAWEGPPRVTPPLEARAWARDFERELGLEAPWVLLHPGGGGSAGRPDPETFGRFAAATAAATGASVVLTAGPGEEALAARAAATSGGRVLPPVPDLLRLAALLERSQVVLAGSTGPLHLAAAVGAAVVGLYPHKASQAIRRWGPQGPAATALAPPPQGCGDCEAATCARPQCFARLAPGAVAQAAREVLTRRHAGHRGRRR